VTRRTSYVVVAAAAAVPRLLVLLVERNDILEAFVEKSDLLARTFVDFGTFGYLPGEPSASTQPLYGWFLIPVYWAIGRDWWSIGLAQIAVAAATAVLVYEIGRRFLSQAAGLIAAIASTLHPYLVWHDVHVNREILDQLLGAALFLLALLAGSRRSWALAAALGAVTGVAILSNSRLTLLPLVLAAYLLWRGAGWTSAAAVVACAALVLVPWVVRNKAEVGCFTLTTDARALWKANNVNTYDTLADGKWIDDVPDLHPRQKTPQEAGDIYRATGRVIHVDECGAQRRYQHLVTEFWKHHPGEKAKLAAQATWMLWDPRVGLQEGRPEAGGALDTLRRWAEPAFTIPLFVLAVVGLWYVPPAFRWLAVALVAYETAMAWIFAGQTRYRVPWDFVLALLAAAAVTRLPFRPFRPSSQKR
jgi:4-amino-4-deoxy-L-arabinose transferase-like glycosyltransferase